MLDNARVIGIVAAGGAGERMGAEGGKQLLEIAGRPAAAWSTQALAEVFDVDEVIVVCDPDRIEEYSIILSDHVLTDTPLSFVGGGATRTESVFAGLCAISDEPTGSEHNDQNDPHSADEDDDRSDPVTLSEDDEAEPILIAEHDPLRETVIVIHDGARPLATSEMIQDALDELTENYQAHGVVVGYPCSDTLKRVEDGWVVETPPRSRYWTVQTPQIFRLGTLLDAYKFALENRLEATDDSALVEAAGFRVVMHEGPRDNIKITTPEDVAFVEATLQARK
ncbi:MAG: 2-C-methyl-D-erythritol 4-phosphate cytidylyltransferase [Coriobacteriia bacterium]|nr:2-C-methyl-D-erythritol 4-phosphate cytidylyltransferase [Coriobacteriia bacterium]